MKHLLPLCALALAMGASAQSTPVGVWHSIDDKSGEAKAEIRLSEAGGVVSGRIERFLRKDADPARRCTDCQGDRKDQPVLGMEIVRGAKKAEGKEAWEGGRILDPENGKEYGLRLAPVDGGKRLEVRGYLGPFWRTQHWVRVQ